MVDYMKCVKTGCDVVCDGQIYHGDLFFHDGALFISDIPKAILENPNFNVNCLEFEGKTFNYHFKAKSLFEIPCGYNFKCFMIKGVYDVQESFLNQIKTYSSYCLKSFEV